MFFYFFFPFLFHPNSLPCKTIAIYIHDADPEDPYILNGSVMILVPLIHFFFFFPLQQEDILAGWLIVVTYQPIYSVMLTLLDTSYCQLRDASNILHFAWRLEFSRNILKDGSCCSQLKVIFILLIWVLHI